MNKNKYRVTYSSRYENSIVDLSHENVFDSVFFFSENSQDSLSFLAVICSQLVS